MTNTILVAVNPAKALTDRVILWERHPAHPDGEAYIAGNTQGQVAVAETPAIRALINQGLVIRAEAGPLGVAEAQAQPDEQPEAGPLGVAEAQANGKRGRPRK